MERKYNEKIIIRSGKLQYAIQLDEGKSRNHIIIENGKAYFTDSWYSDAATFNFNDEAHRIAKEIFISQLQTDIKSKIAELRLLEEVFKSINLSECLGTIIPESSKLLLNKTEVKEEITKQIEEQVKPIARKKKKIQSEVKEVNI